MAMRRPRLKAAVNLAPRRSAAASKPDPQPSTVVQSKEETPPQTEPSPEPEIVTSSTPDPKPTEESQPRDQPNEPIKSSAPRRIIKPSVCLPIRKRKVPSNDPEPQPEPASARPIILLDPPPEPIEETKPPPSSPLPAPHFKPPFLSPSMQNLQNQKRADLVVYNPFTINDENRPGGDLNDDAGGYQSASRHHHHPPQSPNKVRQRIRPTPCFGHHRRNSMSQVSRVAAKYYCVI